jgi:hypothetical protein
LASPIDDVIAAIRGKGYHNHRREEHSDVLSLGLVTDLQARCPKLRQDFQSGSVAAWLNKHIPAARGKGKKGRLADLIVGPGEATGKQPSADFRVLFEHKSVVTAHRNARARFGDLNEILEVAHKAQPHAILVATVLIGVAENVLNVPDRIVPFHTPTDFTQKILPRLSTGDQALWTDFPKAVSKNKPGDPAKTVAIFRELRTRPFGRTDIVGYDYVLLIPVDVDNVNVPRVARDNSLGIDVDHEYSKMAETVCQAYGTRW